MAQCCEIQTAVGLSRKKDSDLRLFLPPPPCPKSVKESSIPIQFWNILSKLPDQDVHECIKYFTTTALHGKIHCDLDRYCLLLLAEFVYFTEADNTLQKHELPKGSFTNYVSMFFLFFDPLPPSLAIVSIWLTPPKN